MGNYGYRTKTVQRRNAYVQFNKEIAIKKIKYVVLIKPTMNYSINYNHLL